MEAIAGVDLFSHMQPLDATILSLLKPSDTKGILWDFLGYTGIENSCKHRSALSVVAVCVYVVFRRDTNRTEIQTEEQLYLCLIQLYQSSLVSQ